MSRRPNWSQRPSAWRPRGSYLTSSSAMAWSARAGILSAGRETLLIILEPGYVIRRLNRSTRRSSSSSSTRRIPSATVAFFHHGNEVGSTGYGYRDREFREPCSPLERLKIGNFSVSLAAGAMHSLIAKKKELETATISEILRPSPASKDEKGRPAAGASVQSDVTVAAILEGIGGSHKEFTHR